MSDTITITAEEREMWASIATARINAVMPERQCEITAQERLVKSLKALEQAEANVAQLQQRVNDLLSEELTDGAVRERIQLRFNMHEVLQQNERLSKMVDWLAGRCSEELGFTEKGMQELRGM